MPDEKTPVPAPVPQSIPTAEVKAAANTASAPTDAELDAVIINETITGADAGPVLTMPHSAADLTAQPKAEAKPEEKHETSVAPVPQERERNALADEVGLPKIIGAPSHLEPAVPSLGPRKMPDRLTAQTDVAHILQEIKLPERHTVRASGDVKEKNALLASMPQAVNAPPDEIAVSTMPKMGEMEDLLLQPKAEGSAASDDGSDAITSLHTLKDDLQTVVQEQKISFVHAVALEEDKRRARAADAASRSPGAEQRLKRTASTVFAVTLLLAAGAAALSGVFFIMQQHASTTPVPIATDSLMFAEQSVAFPIDALSPNDVKQAIAQKRSGGAGPVGSIIRVIPTLRDQSIADPKAQRRYATAQEFLTALGIHAPDELARSLDSTFFFGLHTADKTAPVLIIPVISYDRAFAAMLKWEPMMNTDLSPLFAAVPTTMKDPTDGAIKPRVFQDVVMRNFDVRALKDDAGTVQLYYSFPTPKLLIIAESPYSFAEVLSRLQAGRKL